MYPLARFKGERKSSSKDHHRTSVAMAVILTLTTAVMIPFRRAFVVFSSLYFAKEEIGTWRASSLLSLDRLIRN